MFLGIDIGSSYIKSALLNTNDNIICDVKRVKTPAFLKNNDTKIKEYHPYSLIEAIRSEIDERIDKNAIDGIVLSTQMHGFILVDDAGESISRYVSWQDERALNELQNSNESYFKAAYSLLGEEMEQLETGAPRVNLSMYPLYHFMQCNHIKSGAHFMMMGDYILYSLTGNRTQIHITNAASTGMVDLRKGAWNDKIIKVLGFEGLSFPMITHDMNAIGEYRGVKLYPAVGDQQASILGIDKMKNTDLIINIATGSQVSLVTDDFALGDYEVRPYFDGKYLFTKTDIVSGRNIDVLVDCLASKTIEKKSQIWDRIRSIDKISVSKDEAPDINLDYYTYDDEGKAYINRIISSKYTIEEITLGAFYDIAKKLHSAATNIAIDKDIDRIMLSGGFAQSVKVIGQIIENEFDIDCFLCPEKEEALFGLLKLAKKI